MKNLKPVLSGKGLLAASVALLSGTALAETAGRVSFVIGDVTASNTDGSTRLLKRGDVINGGDKISTRTGRIQLRFTDGGFVSLQPNTVFGVDEYLYTNRKPEETSLFFSLLQGGMRTITGAIGKVNKQSYKVRTPVATIGIRGTGYRARVGEDGRLLVSVGSGFVNISTKTGNITAGAGQNIQALTANSSPTLTDETADVSASGVSGDQGDADQEEQSQEQQAQQGQEGGLSGETVATTDLQNEQGYTEITATDPVTGVVYQPNTQGSNPLPSTGLPMSAVLVKVYPTNNQLGHDSGLVVSHDAQGLLTVMSGEGGSTSTTVFERGTLKVVNKGANGSTRWGEFTDGQSGTNLLFAPAGGSLTLSSTQFQPWITAAAFNVNQSYQIGVASYSLAGGTARNSFGAGQLRKFDITYNFATQEIGVLLKVAALTAAGGSLPAGYTTGPGGVIYEVNTTSSLQSPGVGGAFDLSALPTTIDGAVCSSGCTTDIHAVFSGSYNAQIAASYSITDTQNSGAGAYGVASLNKTSSPTLLANQQLLSPSNDAVSIGGLQLALGNTGGLQAISSANGVQFDKGNLSSVGSKAGGVYWGELSVPSVGGVASINTLFDPLTANIPTYMWVSSAPLVNGYTEGKATFALKGGLVNSAANLGGSIGQFNLTFNFDTSLADVSLVASAHQTGGGTRIYTAQGTGLQVGLINSGITIDHISTTSSTGIAGECSAGCETNIAALFSGDHNAQIGAGFHIETMSGTTLAYGVAALNKTSYTAPTPNTIPVLPDSVVDNNPNSLYYYAPAYNVLGAVCSDSGCVVGDINIGMGASFDRSAGANRGSLLTVKQAIDQQGTMVENQSFDRGSLTASNVGKSGDLSWGRLGDGSTSISSAFDNGANNGLSTSRSLIYIVGSSPLLLPATGAAKYSYKGGDNDSGATVNKFDMTFNFDLATVNLDAALQVGSNTVTLRTKDIAGQLGPVGMAFVGGSTLVSASFAIDPTMIQVTDGGSCTAGNNNCVANVKGYFAGAQSSQLGVYYDITGVSLVSKISGVAALDSAGNVLPAPSTIPQPSRGYSVSYSYAGGSGMAAGNDWSGSFGENEITSQRQIFDTNGMLQQSWGEVCVLCDSAVSSVETASRGYTPSTPLAVTPLLHWGRWVGAGANGSAITVEGVDETLGAGKYLHYITGVATSAAVFQAGTYNNLEATYLFKGGTAATGSDGSTGSIVAGSSIRAVFGSDITQLGLNIGVKMDGSDGAIYRLESGLGTPNSALQVVGSSFNQSNLIVNNAGTGNACASNGCMADINGFFAGQQAQQIGLSYHINDNSIYTPRTVDGVGAFVRPAMTAYNSNNPVD